MINLNRLLSEMQLSRAALARLVGVSGATVTLLLNHGHWPRTPEVNHRMRQRITELLTRHGVAPERVATAFEECAEQRANWTSHAAQLTEAEASTPSPQANIYQPKDEDMLPPKSRITTEALDHFALERDPFTNEMRGVADVFINDNIRKVRSAVRNVAEYGGMLAVIAESGAGKSTVRKDLAHWIKTSNRPATHHASLQQSCQLQTHPAVDAAACHLPFHLALTLQTQAVTVITAYTAQHRPAGAH